MGRYQESKAEIKGERKMFGFISKKKVAREIAKIYKEKNVCRNTREEALRDWEVQSALNLLCTRLNIKPMHRNKLGGGTGEMLGGVSNE